MKYAGWSNKKSTTAERLILRPEFLTNKMLEPIVEPTSVGGKLTKPIMYQKLLVLLASEVSAVNKMIKSSSPILEETEATELPASEDDIDIILKNNLDRASIQLLESSTPELHMVLLSNSENEEEIEEIKLNEKSKGIYQLLVIETVHFY